MWKRWTQRDTPPYSRDVSLYTTLIRIDLPIAGYFEVSVTILMNHKTGLWILKNTEFLSLNTKV